MEDTNQSEMESLAATVRAHYATQEAARMVNVRDEVTGTDHVVLIGRDGRPELSQFVDDSLMRFDAAVTAQAANMWVDGAMRRPDPKPLWGTLWFEDEVACLFADTNMGKSILAVQIADDIAREGRRVLYFDFELSDKQFQVRYTAPDGAVHRFADTFIRAEFDQCELSDDLDRMMRAIGTAAARHNCRVVIIDNITWICNRSESGDVAAELMTMLVGLKRRMGLSILCLAHTPKRSVTSALTQNSLAGSKRIANFMDSIFAIGTDRTNQPGGRYIKQIKVRNAPMEYGEDNVLTAELRRAPDGMLRFDITGNGHENDLLTAAPSRTAADAGREAERLRVLELLGQGMTQREVARELGISSRKVSTIYREASACGDVQPTDGDPR